MRLGPFVFVLWLKTKTASVNKNESRMIAHAACLSLWMFGHAKRPIKCPLVTAHNGSLSWS